MIMNARILLVSLIILNSFNLLGQKKVKLKTETDSVSYAIGVSMYEAARKFNHEINYEIVTDGMKAAAEDRAVMSVEDAHTYINRISLAEHEAEVIRNREAGIEFLEENRKREGVIETSSGLQYLVVKLGEGPVPVPEDIVKVHYSGYMLDGTKFDSSLDRGEPAVFPVAQVIEGWTEALLLMPVGSEYKVFLPAELAYGERQMGDDIKPGSVLIFDIHLLEIMK
jgi:FKBP-type peptidyl-prolyl cis-trans isomerase